ncbi:agmatine deiminase family protein [Nocardia sp. CT2-14]|uniref:Agmatine deiminase family protein n=1 Tax=Nocardia aurantiaca TaxID=2675850 RepID=A0A6I3L6Q3_9NOCA|nr:agmatine deiminase family protein [Nocardia aurantiaca]
MPDEGQPHRRTWMAFGADERVWTAELLPRIREDVARIARAVAQFEPVSMLVRPEEFDLARALAGSQVALVPAEMDDLWLRDSGPVFVRGDGASAAVDFNFNGWGGKQDHRKDARLAALVAERSDAEVLTTELVLEGGGIEVDGAGTAIITESCVLNDNRNPGWQRADVEAELARLLGISKVIWLPGIADHDVTDGHTDFYARFAGPGVVLAGREDDPNCYDYGVTRRHLAILQNSADAQGRPLRVEVIPGPMKARKEFTDDEFAAGYMNFYVCNGGVVAPEFGDPWADAYAEATLARLFPGRRVVQIDVDAVAAGGGGIHCTTQQEPV